MSGIQPNRQRYLLSLAEELHSQANRVRDLIGEAHWLSDGHHKEYLLIDLLRRYLPSGLTAARGFVVSPTDPGAVSTEQDVLVVDTLQESPVFNQGNMLIAFPRAVRAAISVKTKLDNDSVRDSVSGLSTVRNVAMGHINSRAMWCGAYYFDLDPAVSRNPALVFDQVRRAVKGSPVIPPVSPQPHPWPAGPDLHCSARELAFKLQHAYVSDPDTTVPPRLLGYRCQGLATAIFLGELLDHIAAERGAGDADFSRFTECDAIELLGIEPLTPTPVN
jgi:hypothetical protein